MQMRSIMTAKYKKKIVLFGIWTQGLLLTKWQSTNYKLLVIKSNLSWSWVQISDL